MADYPCGTDGVCMACHALPEEVDRILCSTCGSLWHAPCLTRRPPSLADTLSWTCPDCSGLAPAGEGPEEVVRAKRGGIVEKVMEIMKDESLNDVEKVKRRQELLGGNGGGGAVEEEDEEAVGVDKGLRELDNGLKCNFCFEVLDRPVSIPCGHNFCLKCFQNSVRRGNMNCPKCRKAISPKICSQPRINAALVNVIRLARIARSATSSGPTKVQHFIHNQSRPDKAFTTERAKKTGKANACSGKIFVTVPPDHFGPILADNDPERGTGVLVGESWEDRMECRQWGAHLPHVAGIAGQSAYGAQSVALSGGYEDDEDHGDWFLYTGSGGRDLSGNKRTNKEHSFDQKFEKMNEALRVSCKKGYPVRVVRSHKEKRSSYAPDTGVRYDGIYRIEKCWRKPGAQGHKVCRYLFVRCDNAPAPWTSDVHGDRPRDLPAIKELKKNATDVFERKEPPSWDYDIKHGWKWMKAPPPSKKVAVCSANPEDRKIGKRAFKQTHLSIKEKLLKEFSCLICKNVLNLPMTTPCAHNFCKSCLDDAFAGKSFVRERGRDGGRALRQQKNVIKCPCCPTDISDFLQNPNVNTDLKGAIETLQKQIKEEADEASEDSVSGISDEALEKKDAEVNGGELDISTSENEVEVAASNNEVDIAASENKEVKEKSSEVNGGELDISTSEKLPKEAAAVAKVGGKRKKSGNVKNEEVKEKFSEELPKAAAAAVAKVGGKQKKSGNVENEEVKEKSSEEKLPEAAAATVAKVGGKRKKSENVSLKGKQGSKKAKKSAVNDEED